MYIIHVLIADQYDIDFFCNDENLKDKLIYLLNQAAGVRVTIQDLNNPVSLPEIYDIIRSPIYIRTTSINTETFERTYAHGYAQVISVQRLSSVLTRPVEQDLREDTMENLVLDTSPTLARSETYYGTYLGRGR